MTHSRLRRFGAALSVLVGLFLLFYAIDCVTDRDWAGGTNADAGRAAIAGMSCLVTGAFLVLKK